MPESFDEHEDAIDLVYANLGALPDPDYTHLNLMPFSIESDQTNALKRRVSTAIVKLLANAGYTMKLNTTPPEHSRRIRVLCRSCGNVLFTGVTDHHGGVAVAAPSLLATMGRLRIECPHTPLTLEDQRRFIEESVAATEGV